MQTEQSTNILLQTIIAGIQEKKGKNIVSLDFSPLDNSVCKYFVICNGDSNTHVQAIANSVEDFTQRLINMSVWHIEGRDNAHWIILDYSDVVVHVFQTTYREYYDLEALWADCSVIKHEEILSKQTTNNTKSKIKVLVK